jgi:hypothetical protein
MYCSLVGLHFFGVYSLIKGNRMSKGKFRLQMDISYEFRDKIDAMKPFLFTTSRLEVVRRAIILFGKIIEAEKKGYKLILRNEEGNEKEIIIS